MSSLLLVVDSSDIHVGKVEEVKAGVDDLVAFVEENEAEPLAYDIYFDEAGTRMTVVQIHPDSASLERHLTVAGPVFRRFDLLKRHERSRCTATRARPRSSRSEASMLGDARVTTSTPALRRVYPWKQPAWPSSAPGV